MILKPDMKYWNWVYNFNNEEEEMREIKYKAWHINLRRMYEVKMLVFNDTASGDDNSGEPKKDWIYVIGKREFHEIPSWCAAREYFKLVEYTGLKDCNKEEIYSSYLVAIGDPEHEVIREVIFQDGAFGVNMQGYFVELNKYCNDVMGNLVEIVGNKFENANLLKEKNDSKD